MHSLLLLSATRMEGAFLESWASHSVSFMGRPLYLGDGWAWLVGGVGKVNAAASLAAYVEAYAPLRVLMLGIAGSYPDSGLVCGALTLASEEIQADLGPVTGGIEALGFPSVSVAGRVFYNRFPTDPGFTGELAGMLNLVPRVFLTHDRPSESPSEARRRAEFWMAAVENMEGAAAAQTALWLGLPFTELRAVSNPAGERNKRNWCVREATNALARAFERILR